MSREFERIRQLKHAEESRLKQYCPKREGIPVKYVEQIKKSPQGKYINQSLAWIVVELIKENDRMNQMDTSDIQQNILPKSQINRTEIDFLKSNYMNVFGTKNSTNIINQREDSSKNVNIIQTAQAKREYSAAALRYGRLYGQTLNNNY